MVNIDKNDAVEKADQSDAENVTAQMQDAPAPNTKAKGPKITSIGDWWGLAKTNPFFAPILGYALMLIIADQISKHWIYYGIRLQDRPFGKIEISNIFDFTFVQNKGVSFGLFQGGMLPRVIFTTLAIAVSIALIYWLASIKRRWLALGVGSIIAGALGNAYDRAVYGWVIDFIDFSDIGFVYVFNVADMCINLGVFFLVLDFFFGKDPEGKTPTAA